MKRFTRDILQNPQNYRILSGHEMYNKFGSNWPNKTDWNRDCMNYLFDTRLSEYEITEVGTHHIHITRQSGHDVWYIKACCVVYEPLISEEKKFSDSNIDFSVLVV